MKRILIVDDDATNRAVLSDVFMDEPYELIEAVDGEDALAKARSHEPDLILLDIMMPKMDGITVMRHLFADPRTCAIPVIVISALGSESQVIACLEEGALEHITKPFSTALVRARVHAILRTSAVAHVAAEPVRASKGNVVAMIGAKGGVGTSTVALNVASAIGRRSDGRTIVAEIRSQLGTFATMLECHPGIGLDGLAEENPKYLDIQTVEKHLIDEAHNGFQILFGPHQGYFEFAPQLITTVVNHLAMLGNHVVLDLPASLDPSTLAALRAADQRLIVIEPETASLNAANALIDHLENTERGLHVLGTILNRRTASTAQLTIGKCETVLGLHVIGMVPPDPEGCVLATRKGAPLVVCEPERTISTSLSDLAGRLISTQVGATIEV